jgi:hypothetical protein
MSDTPETDASRGYALSSHYGRIEGSYLQMDRSGPFVHAEVARKLERERDEARKHLRDANRGAEINAHINQKFAQQLIDAREKIKNQAERICVLEGATNHACGTPLTRALRERDEAMEQNAKLRAELDQLMEGVK